MKKKNILLLAVTILLIACSEQTKKASYVNAFIGTGAHGHTFPGATTPFVILTTGLDIILLSVLIYSIDLVQKPVNYHFFEVFGKNSLVIYLLSEYLAIGMNFIRVIGDQSLYTYIYEIGFSWIGQYYGAFFFALVFMFICWAAGWWLHKKKIYIKV
jgi:predicted acyltransferase